MIIPISPKYKFVCDRCGKEIFAKENGYLEAGQAYSIAVSVSEYHLDRVPKKVDVCLECRDEFTVFLDNFIDDVNKEGET